MKGSEFRVTKGILNSPSGGQLGTQQCLCRSWQVICMVHVHHGRPEALHCLPLFVELRQGLRALPLCNGGVQEPALPAIGLQRHAGWHILQTQTKRKK